MADVFVVIAKKRGPVPVSLAPQNTPLTRKRDVILL